MKQNIRWRLVCLLLISFLSAYGWEYNSESIETHQTAQIRVGAEFSKKWRDEFRLSFAQDLRSDVYNAANGAAFRTSFSTLCFAYSPIPYLKLDAGYTLKISNKDTTDPNELLRHRVFASVTGSYKWSIVKLSLRERALMEARTDSVNPLEKNRYNWQLRSKVSADFTIPGKPLKPYVWCELINTLNAPEYQQKNGHQFINQVRTQAGLKWRITRLSSLDFYYRFTYGYDRDINITKKKAHIELTEEILYQHAIGVIYHLDW